MHEFSEVLSGFTSFVTFIDIFFTLLFLLNCSIDFNTIWQTCRTYSWRVYILKGKVLCCLVLEIQAKNCTKYVRKSVNTRSRSVKIEEFLKLQDLSFYDF